MAEAGIDDILIATNILGAARSGRLASLGKLPLKSVQTIMYLCKNIQRLRRLQIGLLMF